MLALLLVLLSSPLSKTASDFICGTRPTRTAEVLALDRYRIRKFGFPATTDPLRPSNDQGNISVIEDDGTLITRPNSFDLSGMSVTFTPSTGAYSVTQSVVPFDGGAGDVSIQTLSDDDSVEIQLPFRFTYFGKAYSSVFLNTDGNLTFGEGDRASTERDLQRMINGAPRIAPLLDDLNPVSPARIMVEKLSDRIVFDWINTGEWVSAGSARGRNTFQAILFSNGIIRFTYLTLDAQQAVVGISPGGGTTTIDLIDLSTQTQPASFPGLVAEVFATKQAVSLAAVSQYFYRSHPDAYDFLMIFSDFNISLDSAFAFTISVRNDVSGIITDDEPLFDRGRQFGSAKRLQSMSNMGSLSNYPSDPRRRFLGENNTLSVVSHEFGHRWLAFMDTPDRIMLGRQRAHWSYFNNSSGSVMEGNEIQDLGNGRFRTVGATYRYSPLDQYIMGLRAASEVPPWFVVTQPQFDTLPPSFTSGCREDSMAACSPYVGMEFAGIRRDVSIDEMIRIAGTRVPAVGASPNVFRVGFILLTQKGQSVQASSAAKLEGIRAAWELYFRDAVEGRGGLQTDLVPLRTTSTNFEGAIPANGMRRFETASPETDGRYGYARADSAFGTALLRTQAGPGVLSETEVPPSTAGTSYLAYAENSDGISTRLSIVNPGAAPAQVTIELSSGLRTTISVPPGSVGGGRIQTLFNLTTRGTSFSGTASVRSDVPVAVTALRETLLDPGVPVVTTTVPISPATTLPSEVMAFPQIVDGAGYSTELVLINPAPTAIAGSIEFSFNVATDRGPVSRLSYDIPPGGMWKLRTTNAGSQVQSGFASLVPAAGMSRPVSSAIFSLISQGVLRFQAGVPAQSAVTRAAMFASRETSLRSVLALANRNAQPASVRLTAYDQNGEFVTAATVMVGPGGHFAAFMDELIPGLPSTFHGTIALDSAVAVHAMTMRTRLNMSNTFIMTSMPIIDLNNPPTGPRYFPRVAVDEHVTTEILLMNAGASTFRLQTFGIDGLAPALVQQ